MSAFFFLGYPWSLLLQALAIIHFIRRRPDGYWLWIIIALGPVGALIYIAMEVIPDFGLLRTSLEGFPRRKRIRQLETTVLVNSSAGNYEELADLYLDEGKFDRAKECYDKAISSSRTELPDAHYRRGIALIQLGKFAEAVPDMELIYDHDPKYDLHRAAGLLAHVYANTAETEKADELFQWVTNISTTSEAYYNYAAFLESQKRTGEAREWAQRILAKKPLMPGYLRRRERPWFRKANALLKRTTSS